MSESQYIKSLEELLVFYRELDVANSTRINELECQVKKLTEDAAYLRWQLSACRER